MFFKKMVNRTIISLVLSLTGISYSNAESLIRLQCMDSAADASVYINGKSYGECPADIFISPGNITLRVVKIVDEQYERIYEDNFTLIDNTSKRIKVTLSNPQLNQKALREQAQVALLKARKGDVKAMRDISDFYAKGAGVEKSTEKSQYWSQKIIDTNDQIIAEEILKRAQQGDVNAMNEMADLYLTGKGVDKSEKKSRDWQAKRGQVIADNAKQKTNLILARAESGDLLSMKEVSALYLSGEGIEQSDKKAQYWKEKYKVATKEHAEKQENQQKIQQLTTELEDYNSGNAYLGQYIKSLGDSAGLGNAKHKSFPEVITTIVPTMVFVAALGTVTGVVSSPFNATKHVQLQNELNARAAKWNNSDSMVSKAYEQKLE